MEGSGGLAGRAVVALDVVRWTVAGLIWIHGAARLWNGGVEPFGAWLEGQGFPFGLQQAWAVTIFELVAPIFIIAGRFVTLACLGHIFILSIGLVLVHAPNGWFVVGLGRNGVEYSVVLIVSLTAVGWTYLPQLFARPG